MTVRSPPGDIAGYGFMVVLDATPATLTGGMNDMPPLKDSEAYMPCAPPALPSYAAAIMSPLEATETSRATTLNDDTWKLLSHPTGAVETLLLCKISAAVMEKITSAKIAQRICRIKANRKYKLNMYE